MNYAGAPGAAQIVGQAQAKVFRGKLSLPGLPPQLLPYLYYLGNACGTHGVPLGFQSPRGIDGLGPIQGCYPFLCSPGSPAQLKELGLQLRKEI